MKLINHLFKKHLLASFIILVAIITISYLSFSVPKNNKTVQLVYAATEVKKPTASNDPGGITTTNPSNSFDTVTAGDTTTFGRMTYGQAGPKITLYHSWPTAGQIYTDLFLKLKYSAEAGVDDNYIVDYSISGATNCSDHSTRTWATLIAASNAAASLATSTVSLSSAQNLTQLCVKVYSNKTGSSDNKNFDSYDIWTEGTFTSDTTPPSVMSATTADNDLDGQIDQLRVIYSEAVNDSNFDAVAVTGYSINTGSSSGSGTTTLIYALTESGASDTAATPGLAWTGANAADLAGNLLDSTGAPANATDGAGPAILSASTTTTTSITTIFSEGVTAVSTAITDFTLSSFTTSSSITALNSDNGDNTLIIILDSNIPIGPNETGNINLSGTGVVADSVGNTSTQTALVPVTDDIAPPAPSTPDLDAADDTGSSSSDNLTKNTTSLTFSGTAEANSLVEIFDGAISKGTMTATLGNWSFDLSLSAGVHSITTQATDAALNVGVLSGALSVTVDTTQPSVTLNQAGAQIDPTSVSPINFTTVFSEAVVNFASGDVTLGGTALATTDTVSEISPLDGTTFNVAVSGMTVDPGTVTASIDAARATDLAGNNNLASTSVDNSVTFDTTIPDTTPPNVISINKTDADPTNASSLNWTVTFSENVTGVGSADFSLASSGLVGAAINSVTGGPLIYNVLASFSSGSGTLGLNLVDDDSIIDLASNKLGGLGLGNGNFTGEVYTVDETLPTIPGLPGATSPISDSTPTWTWNASTDSGGAGLASPAYTVEWSQSVTFETVFASSTSNTNSFTHVVVLSDGTWYFRVKAADGAGNESAFSEIGSVTINTGEPEPEPEPIPIPIPIPPPTGGISFFPGTFDKPESPTDGFSLIINSGAVQTTDQNVVLTLVAGANTQKFSVSNYSDFRGAILEDFIPSSNQTAQILDAFKEAPSIYIIILILLSILLIIYLANRKVSIKWLIFLVSLIVIFIIIWSVRVFGSTNLVMEKSWLLTPGAGLKTVYAKYYTSFGQSSEVFSDSIIYEPIVEKVEEIKTAEEVPPAAPLVEEEVLPPFQFNLNLRRGMRHPDVLKLQQFLNRQGFIVAQSGNGSPGHETDYFGGRTYHAVRNFQEFYAVEILLAPYGRQEPTGLFLNYSRLQANSILKKSPQDFQDF